MFLLTTAGSVFLGFAYAGLVNRRFGAKDWRRWMALTPFWVLAVGVALALHTVNMTDLAPQAIQGFAIGSLAATLSESLRGIRRRRVDQARQAHSSPALTGDRDPIEPSKPPAL